MCDTFQTRCIIMIIIIIRLNTDRYICIVMVAHDMHCAPSSIDSIYWRRKKIWICYQLDLFGNWICALDTDIEPVFYGVAYRRRHHHD